MMFGDSCHIVANFGVGGLILVLVADYGIGVNCVDGVIMLLGNNFGVGG